MTEDNRKWTEAGKRRCLVYGVIDIDRLLRWDEIESVSGVLFWSLLGHIAFAGYLFYPESDNGFSNFLSIDMEIDDKLITILHTSRVNWLESGMWANHLLLRLDKDWDTDLYRQTMDDMTVLNVAVLANLYLTAMKKRGFDANDPEFQRPIIGRCKTRNEEILDGR